jgi:hypothetical protein
MAATGIRPASLADILAARPSGVQDRWFARLYFVKPLAIGGLALASVGTGIATLLLAPAGWPAAALAEAGLAAAATTALMAVAAIAHIMLGLAALVRSSARASLIGMVLVAIGGALFDTMMIVPSHASQPWLQYLVIGAAASPKILAALATLAILDDR